MPFGLLFKLVRTTIDKKLGQIIQKIGLDFGQTPASTTSESRGTLKSSS